MKINIDDRVINLIEPLMKNRLNLEEMEKTISLMLISSLDNYVNTGGKGVDIDVLESLKKEYSKMFLKQLLMAMLEEE
ncbi:hypothetical protein [Gemella sp.]